MQRLEEVKFRLADKEDYDAVISLMRQLNPADPRMAELPGKKIFTKILTTDGLFVYLAEENGEIVATCYLNIVPNLTRAGRSYALIENVVTDHNRRRCGIGKSLLTHVIAKAFDSDCYKVMLLSGRNKSVHLFYENCGFDKMSKTAFIIRA